MFASELRIQAMPAQLFPTSGLQSGLEMPKDKEFERLQRWWEAT